APLIVFRLLSRNGWGSETREVSMSQIRLLTLADLDPRRLRRSMSDGRWHAGGTELMTPKQAAEYLKLSTDTLARLRVSGRGPSYIKFGPGRSSMVRYHKTDIDSWISARRFSGTFQYQKG